MGNLIKTKIWLTYAIHFVVFLGICIAVYALAVEIYMDMHPEYIPHCDINSYISCSKALQSRWGKGLGLVAPIFGENSILNQKNPIYGIALYLVLMILTMINHRKAATALVWLSVFANLTSVYLAYILYFEVKALCVVCLSTYAVNFLLLPLTIWHRRTLNDLAAKKRR